MVKRAGRSAVLHVRLDRASPVPLPLQLAARMSSAINEGRVPAGTRLPATRALAGALGVSRNTVMAAYDELLAQGLVSGRVGDGSYVTAAAPAIQCADLEGNPLILIANQSPWTAPG
jgi:GntR family transcriptional regulator/MocR family aminotransferase